MSFVFIKTKMLEIESVTGGSSYFSSTRTEKIEVIFLVAPARCVLWASWTVLQDQKDCRRSSIRLAFVKIPYDGKPKETYKDMGSS